MMEHENNVFSNEKSKSRFMQQRQKIMSMLPRNYSCMSSTYAGALDELNSLQYFGNIASEEVKKARRRRLDYFLCCDVARHR